METQSKVSAKDVFVNLGAIISLFCVVGSLVNLLFTIIDNAYPQIYPYSSVGSSSISWPVSIILVFSPIFISLMWLLEKEYKIAPEKQHFGIHKWISYFTLFIAGIVIAGDLITVLYYFIDGQAITTDFVLKIIVLLFIALGIFSYYILDVRDKLNARTRKIYRAVMLVVVVGSIVWGFAVLGSPRNQRLIKYDEQRVADLQSIVSIIDNYYQIEHKLPSTLEESKNVLNSNYYNLASDPETKLPYEYKKTSDSTYDICAVFNKDSKENNLTSGTTMYNSIMTSFAHKAGRYCFNQTINTTLYGKPVEAGKPKNF